MARKLPNLKNFSPSTLRTSTPITAHAQSTRPYPNGLRLTKDFVTTACTS